jgi:hypothetical protein
MRNATQVEKSTEAKDTETGVEDRTLRALEEPMSVLPDAVDAVGMVEVVSHTGETYVVDVHGGNCECPDASYRLDDDELCKHARVARFVLGVDAVPAEALKEAEPHENLGAFVEDFDGVRVATTDGGVIEAGDGAEVLTDDERDDETEECDVCAELDGNLGCFECEVGSL